MTLDEKIKKQAQGTAKKVQEAMKKTNNVVQSTQKNNTKSTDTRRNNPSANKTKKTAPKGSRTRSGVKALTDAAMNHRPSWKDTPGKGTGTNFVKKAQEYRRQAAPGKQKKVKARSTLFGPEALKRAANAKPTIRNDWGVDFWSDYARTLRGERAENYTPEYRVKDMAPLVKLKGEANTAARNQEESALSREKSIAERLNRVKLGSMGSKKLKNWIDERPQNYREDKGSTLAQVNRLAALYGAIDPITQGYSRAHAKELHKDVQDAPVSLQELFIKYAGRLHPVKNDPNIETAYFDVEDGTVHGDQRAFEKGSSSNSPGQIHWHEYGHNLDWLAGENGYKYHPLYTKRSAATGESLGQAIKDDWDNSLKDYWKDSHRYIPYVPRLALDQFQNDMVDLYGKDYSVYGGISDMLGPYSLNHGGSSYPLNIGHDKTYISQDELASAEAFADLTSSSIKGGEELKLARAFLPNAYEYYMEMLKSMTKNADKKKQEQDTEKRRVPRPRRGRGGEH